MIRTKIAVALLFAAVSGFSTAPADDSPQSPAVQSKPAAHESWRKEFDELCAKTEDAMTFSQDELSSLIQRCDTLLPQLEKLDDSTKKVYLGRLRMCRGLYAYVLEAKQNEKK